MCVINYVGIASAHPSVCYQPCRHCFSLKVEKLTAVPWCFVQYITGLFPWVFWRNTVEILVNTGGTILTNEVSLGARWMSRHLFFLPPTFPLPSSCFYTHCQFPACPAVHASVCAKMCPSFTPWLGHFFKAHLSRSYPDYLYRLGAFSPLLLLPHPQQLSCCQCPSHGLQQNRATWGIVRENGRK